MIPIRSRLRGTISERGFIWIEVKGGIRCCTFGRGSNGLLLFGKVSHQGWGSIWIEVEGSIRYTVDRESNCLLLAEMRAIFTLVKDIIYILSICSELQLQLALPAIIMEDNSAVITVTTDESAYAKKCKHFLMLINYVREQVDLGIIKVSLAKTICRTC